ncbi:MAG TPA: hypothetical protein VE967_07915 [Gemmatimonadaceae bacterium]|nr:hypothetical protein [Gemmatimonadaceae bacterium]
MSATEPAALLNSAVADYRKSNDLPKLLSTLRGITSRTEFTPADLMAATEPYRDIPEVAGPVYETIVAREPANARALVILANAYWLSGRGPDVVGELASRAIAADATNRGAWHLWALTAEVLRERVTRWEQVSKRFPADDLARAALADNAASLASTEDDPVALKLAIDTFTELRERTANPAQRRAIDDALNALG